MATMLSTNAAFLSVQETAVVLGLTDGRIRQLLLAGDIAGQKIGKHAWAISSDEVDRLKKARSPKRPHSKAS